MLGGGATQGGNLCLLQDGSECVGALGSDPVGNKTANKGRDGGRVSVSCGRRHKSEHYLTVAHSRLEIIVSLRMAASAEAPSSPM